MTFTTQSTTPGAATVTEPQPHYPRVVHEGVREAAAHVLALLDEQEPVYEFVDHLLAAAPEKRVAIVSALVSVVSRKAVASPDMATLKVKLRLMAKEPIPDE